MAHGVGDRVVALLEGDIADTETSPSRGRQSLRWTIPVNIVRCSFMHRAPSTRIEKCQRLVHATKLAMQEAQAYWLGSLLPYLNRQHQWRHRQWPW